ncbi:unnamed protein product [Echinostoma caproni]|uniref:CUB domain-containing protein n=1 Tax=Echinostoma caproni TaxID=27848 RepID=A0A183B6L7_9TREM|nr:unnamed protein product [Echinostoma caproni]
MQDHLYSTDDVLQPVVGRGFRCLTCDLPSGQIYGYPGWTYRQYFKYSHCGAFLRLPDSSLDRLLVLVTDQSHLERIEIGVYTDPFNPLTGTHESIIYQPQGPTMSELAIYTYGARFGLIDTIWEA